MTKVVSRPRFAWFAPTTAASPSPSATVTASPTGASTAQRQGPLKFSGEGRILNNNVMEIKVELYTTNVCHKCEIEFHIQCILVSFDLGKHTLQTAQYNVASIVCPILCKNGFGFKLLLCHFFCLDSPSIFTPSLHSHKSLPLSLSPFTVVFRGPQGKCVEARASKQGVGVRENGRMKERVVLVRNRERGQRIWEEEVPIQPNQYLSLKPNEREKITTHTEYCRES